MDLSNSSSLWFAMSGMTAASDSSLLNVTTEQSLGCMLTLHSGTKLQSAGLPIVLPTISRISLSFWASDNEKSINAVDLSICDRFGVSIDCAAVSVGIAEQPVSGSSSDIADNSRFSIVDAYEWILQLRHEQKHNQKKAKKRGRKSRKYRLKSKRHGKCGIFSLSQTSKWHPENIKRLKLKLLMQLIADFTQRSCTIFYGFIFTHICLYLRVLSQSTFWTLLLQSRLFHMLFSKNENKNYNNNKINTLYVFHVHNTKKRICFEIYINSGNQPFSPGLTMMQSQHLNKKKHNNNDKSAKLAIIFCWMHAHDIGAENQIIHSVTVIFGWNILFCRLVHPSKFHTIGNFNDAIAEQWSRRYDWFVVQINLIRWFVVQ